MTFTTFGFSVCSILTPSEVLSVEQVTEQMLANIAECCSAKIYDPEYGSSCHQCRQKTLDTNIGTFGSYFFPGFQIISGEHLRTNNSPLGGPDHGNLILSRFL